MEFNILEITGTAIGVLYLWLEYRASAWLWVASIAMPAIYIGVYYEAGLYADLGISVYYILASVYGLICWLRAGRKSSVSVSDDGSSEDDAGITSFPRKLLIPVVVAGLAVFAVISWILQRFTDSTVPVADGLTTALSIVAMWMLSRKYVEQWLVWLVADIGCAVLYCYKGLWFTGLLYLAYAVIALAGYKKWKSIMSANLSTKIEHSS